MHDTHLLIEIFSGVHRQFQLLRILVEPILHRHKNTTTTKLLHNTRIKQKKSALKNCEPFYLSYFFTFSTLKKNFKKRSNRSAYSPYLDDLASRLSSLAFWVATFVYSSWPCFSFSFNSSIWASVVRRCLCC